MLSSSASMILPALGVGFRQFSAAAAAAAGRKVAILGAAGGIGQHLSLLMKMNSSVSQLALYDLAGTVGVAADVGHMNTPAVAKGYEGDAQLGDALKGCDMVIIPAGIPRKPGMTRDDLFKINAGIVANLVKACGKYCPSAQLHIISNPVNSTVPIAVEVLKKMNVYDKRKVMGITTLDVVRAKTFYAQAKLGSKLDDILRVDVPVIGGHAGITILPLFSQASPKHPLTAEEQDALTKRTQDGGTEVVAAKAGKGSATASMAYAAALFADSCLRAMNGASAVECAYVESDITEAPFFATKVKLGAEGVEKVLGYGKLDDYEAAALKAMMPELISQIQKGIDFAKSA